MRRKVARCTFGWHVLSLRRTWLDSESQRTVRLGLHRVATPIAALWACHTPVGSSSVYKPTHVTHALPTVRLQDVRRPIAVQSIRHGNFHLGRVRNRCQTCVLCGRLVSASALRTKGRVTICLVVASVVGICKCDAWQSKRKQISFRHKRPEYRYDRARRDHWLPIVVMFVVTIPNRPLASLVPVCLTPLCHTTSKP